MEKLQAGRDYVEKLGKETLEKMYFTMEEIRLFEENIGRYYQKGISYGGLHLSIGEEACAVGAMFPLRQEDKIVTYHRGHGHSIAKGADIDRMQAELLSKSTGYCKGRGGSVHLMDMSCGQMGSQGIVGAQASVAVGVALAGRLKGEDYVTVCLFGDGAANQGQVHEGMNLAGVLKLPIVYICINNAYAVSTPSAYSCAGDTIVSRAAGYGMEGVRVDGNDVFQVYDAVERAVEKVKGGSGPIFIELMTYRWHGHWAGDPAYYRAKDELKWWRENRDPIAMLRAYLLEQKVSTEVELDELRAKAQQAVQHANDFAESSPEPSYDEMFADLYYTAGQGEG